MGRRIDRWPWGGLIGGASFTTDSRFVSAGSQTGSFGSYEKFITPSAFGKSVGNFAANYGDDILVGGVHLLQQEHNEQFYYDAIDGMILNNGNSLRRHDMSLTFNKTSGNATYLGFKNGKHRVNFDITDYEVIVKAFQRRKSSITQT